MEEDHSNLKLGLGVRVQHIITGIGGIAVAYSESLNGTMQYCIKRTGCDKSGKTFDDFFVDENMLAVDDVNQQPAFNIVDPVATDIILGQTVEHISGFIGVAIEKITYMNGCVFIGIMPSTDDPNKLPELNFVPCQYLKIKMEEKPIEIATSKAEGPSRGGPASKAPTMG